MVAASLGGEASRLGRDKITRMLSRSKALLVEGRAFWKERRVFSGDPSILDHRLSSHWI